MKNIFLLLPLVILLATTVGDAVAATAAKRPNILWLAGENLAHDLGCYGAQNVRTPNLDRLAVEGVRYTNVIATNPTCAPSRSAFFTGMYQTSTDTHPMRSHRTDAYRLPEGVRPVTHRLRDAGYFTANLKTLDGKEIGTGKLDLNFVNEGPIYHENSGDWSALPKDRPFFAVVNALESEYDIYDRQTWKHARAEWVGEREHEKIATPQNVTPPPYYPDHSVVREEWARYLNSVSGMDKRFGVVLDKLRAEGREDDTVIIFFGDNGRLEPRGIHWCYDSGLRVPLIIRWPKNFPAPARYTPGTVNDEIVSLLDLTATTLAAAGVPRPMLMQGHSLIGERTAPPRSAVFSARDRIDETEQRIRSVHDRRFHYIRTLSSGPTFASLNRYKEKCFPIYPLMRELLAQGKLTGPPLDLMQRTGPSEELYDLRADPHEIKDLSRSSQPEHREALIRLRAALDTWMVETGDRGHIPESREVVAPFEKEMHDWFGTPAWAKVDAGQSSPAALSSLTLAAVLHDEAAFAGAHDIEVRDGIAYIAGKGFTTRALPGNGIFPYAKGKGGSIAIVDVKQPSAPKLLWHTREPLAFEDAETVLLLDRDRVLIGTRDVFLFDVSNPAKPQQLAALKERPRVDIINGLVRRGDVAFGANKEGYIFALDVAKPDRIALLGAHNAREVDGFERPHDLAVSGDLIVVVAPEGFGAGSKPGKLGVYRVAHPQTHQVLPPDQWTLVGKLEHPFLAGANRVMTRGNFAYVGSSLTIGNSLNRPDGLQANVSIVDLSNPAQPRMRGSLEFPAGLGPNGLEVAGAVVFSAGGKTVQAIDVSAPDTPRELARFASADAFPGGTDDAHDLVYHDGHLFVTAQNSHSLVILKVSDELSRRSK